MMLTISLKFVQMAWRSLTGIGSRNDTKITHPLKQIKKELYQRMRRMENSKHKKRWEEGAVGHKLFKPPKNSISSSRLSTQSTKE